LGRSYNSGDFTARLAVLRSIKFSRDSACLINATAAKNAQRKRQQLFNESLVSLGLNR
jgi:hypothetical protein